MRGAGQIGVSKCTILVSMHTALTGSCASLWRAALQAGRQVGGEVGVGRQAEGQQKWSGRVASTPTCQHNNDDPVNQDPLLTSFAPTKGDPNDGADHRNKTGMKPNL